MAAGRAGMDHHAGALSQSDQDGFQRPWPLDSLTGFPLPVCPLDDAPAVYMRSGRPYQSDPDLHHFFFPRASFNGDELGTGGQIVRLTRVQQIRRYHHTQLHKHLGPPPLLSDPLDQFNMSVLALSDYLPRRAIDPGNEEMGTISLDAQQYDKLRKRTFRDFDVQYSSVIGKFFLRVMTTRHIHCLDPIVPEEFLRTKSTKRRYDLARYILHSVAEDAVEPINTIYARSVKDELIPPQSPTPFRVVTFYAKKTKVEATIARAVKEALPAA